MRLFLPTVKNDRWDQTYQRLLSLAIFRLENLVACPAGRYNQDMRKLFSSEQDTELAAVYATGVSVNQLAREHSCSTAAITAALIRAGVVVRRRKLSESDHRQVAERYLAGESGYDLAEAFGVTRPTIIAAIKRAGVTIRDQSKAHQKHHVNEQAFDGRSEESAYWIGMLMADGNVFPPNRINLTLTAGDKEHLLAFRDFVRSGVALRETRPRPIISPRNGRSYMCRGLFSLVICNVTLYQSLLRFGLTPCKSATAHVVGLENDRHFWRGVIDGDGSLVPPHERIRTKRGRQVTVRDGAIVSLVGAQSLLQQFAAFVNALCPSSQASVRSDGRTGWQFAITGVHAVAVIKHLYTDCVISLPRKMAIARRIIG